MKRRLNTAAPSPCGRISPTLTSNLATVLTALSLWDEAVRCCEAVGKLRPEAVPYFTLGYAQFQLGQYESSIACFDRLLALDPDNSEAMAQKARALYFLGRLAEARVLIDRAVELGPDIVEHYVLLAELRQLKPGDARVADAVERLRNARSDDGRLSNENSVRSGSALRSDRTARRIVSMFTRSERAVRRRIDYDIDAAIAPMVRTRQAFTSAFLRSKEGGGDASRKPIFIMGMPRSGTTLTEQILAAHPCVYGAGEIGDFEQCMFSMREFGASDFRIRSSI